MRGYGEHAAAVGQDDFFDGKTEGTGFTGKFHLQAIVNFQRQAGGELQIIAPGSGDFARQRAAVAGGVGINYVALVARGKIQARPRP